MRNLIELIVPREKLKTLESLVVEASVWMKTWFFLEEEE